MNKKSLILSLFFVLSFPAVLLFGDIVIIRTENIKASVSFTANIPINHRHVLRISPYQNEPNFVAVGDYSYPSVTDIKIEYYLNNDSSTVTILPLKEVSSPFESANLTVPSDAASFSYRFAITVNDDAANKTYYPYGSNNWINVPVTSNSTKTIETSGGNIILDNGDQRYGRSEMIIMAGALSSATVTMTETDMNSFSGDKTGMVRLYEIDMQPQQQELLLNAQVTLYYGSSNDGKYVVKHLNGNSWERVNSAQAQDTLSRTITFETKSGGYYGIFVKTDEGNGYRPQYRVFRLGEKIAFRNLVSGDTVTILDINGRQVKKLTSPPFEWDGRRNGGSHAETGSYIYQIKKDGKVISGSMVFVR